MLENDNVNILCDFSVQTDRKLEHNKPDVLIVDKQIGACHTVDVACPFDTRARKGRTIPRIEDRDRETLALQKSGSNSSNH